jgi:beta-glucosidase
VQLGPRELREVYAEPFSAVIQNAGLATIMNSYASVDGLPCAGSPAILTDLLREELGFTGLVVADYDSVAQLRKYHRVAATPGEAGSLALKAGLDMELPVLDCYGEPLKAEIEAGRLSCEVVDTAVRRVLRLKFQLGLFENPYVDETAVTEVFQTPGPRILARQAVAASTILLTNDGVLPLSPTIKRLAVIGPGADDQRLLQGDYHYPAHQELTYQKLPGQVDLIGLKAPQAGGDYAPGPYFTPHVTPLAGLRTALGDHVEISYARGCEVLGDDRSGFAEAIQLAQEADVAVVVVAGKSGLQRPVTVGEGNDATNLDLTGVQPELVEALASTGTPLVVVVLSGRIHTLTSIAEQASALLLLFPAGEEGGNGLADVLTGRVNPAGRLPVTLPRVVGQVPLHSGYRAGGDLALLFGDYMDSPVLPLFAFGHGLSYTTFAYSDLDVQAGDITAPIEVSLLVENTGRCAGDEVVQLYCRDEVASVARPDRMLLGFVRLSLSPGEQRRVVFTIHPSRLAFYDPQMRFVTEPGAFTFCVGASSLDIRVEQKVILDGPVVEYKQREIVTTQVAVV